MKIAKLHSWTLSPRAAVRLQEKLQPRVKLHDDFAEIKTIAGCDLSYGAQGLCVRAAVILYSFF